MDISFLVCGHSSIQITFLTFSTWAKLTIRSVFRLDSRSCHLSTQLYS